jgi:hypothetical protein
MAPDVLNAVTSPEGISLADDGADPKNSAEKVAQEYAWNWFQYHAGQRQAVFRFYLVLAGAISTGYFTSIQLSDLQSLSFLFGAPLAVISFLFWRLDSRSVKLIKLAETYLKIEEQRLARVLGQPEIQLTTRADAERDKRLAFSWVYSFRQIYQIMFLAIGLIGVEIFVFASGSPIGAWFVNCAPTFIKE